MKMNESMQIISLSALDKLIGYANDTLNSLEQYSSQFIDAQMILKFNKSGSVYNRVCQIRLVAPGQYISVRRQCQTFEEAIQQTTQVLKQQLYQRITNRQEPGKAKELELKLPETN
ncbi:MAG: HPF/RaiA family ribosome-associated protein [Chryseolinea sp.]